MVWSASDRRDCCRPEFDRGSTGGIPLRSPRMPGSRLFECQASRSDQSGDLLDPELDGALPGHLPNRVPAVPARPVCDTGGTRPGRRRAVAASWRLPVLPAPTQHWVPFVAADGEAYYGGPSGCAGQPPEAQNVDNGSDFPSNETFGVTGLDGKGSADFDVWTSAENASLGCSQTVACALVAVPIMGISCDPSASGLPAADRPSGTAGSLAVSQCEAKGAFAARPAGEPGGGRRPDRQREPVVEPLELGVTGSRCR